MNKKVIIFLCILIALPFGGDYMLAKGIIDNNIALIIGGAVCCVIWLAFIVITNYVMRQAKKNKQPMTPEEQQQRNITFAKNLSKTLCDDEKDKKERCEKEQKSMNNFNEFKLVLIEKYSQSVFSYIEKITEIYSILFLKMFDNTEIPMSSILVKPYSSTCSQLLKDKILFDGLQCTESKNQSINKQVQELTEVFIQGLKKRIQENSEYDTEDYTFPVLVYSIIRNNVIRYYHDKWLENYGYENLEDFCVNNRGNIQDIDIAKFTYYFIYENDINLPFVNSCLKSYESAKKILKDIKQKEIENDLFESPKKKTVVTKSNVVTFSPIDRIDRMTGEQFEIFMEDYFIKQGFKVKRTPLSGDYGIDLIIENDFSKIGIQAKCYSNKITASAVQEAVAGLRHYGLSSGMVVTNNYFQPAAIQLAKENSITLWDRNMLIKKLND